MALEKNFKDNWVKCGFDEKVSSVLLAVSGGADSMVMADLFLRSGIKFAVAHCNFQLRGQDADKDEQLVKDWCAENNIECHTIRFDTQQKVEEWKKGVQETARILRYEWLEQVRQKHCYNTIATAHHANDNAETLIMNLFKGTGISGLHGIPAQNNKIIRPLLFATRAEIRDYVSEHNVPFREDASNASDKYLRNAVRHKLLPLAEELFPGVVVNLNNTITRLSEAESLYLEAVNQRLKKLCDKRGNDIYISIKKLQQTTPLNTICYELFKPYGFSAAQVPHLIDLLVAENGSVMLSDTHRVIHNRGFLIITTIETGTTDLIKVDTIPNTINTSIGDLKFQLKDKLSVIPDDVNIACVDADKITKDKLILRKWRQGDYFYPIGMGMKKKKLSRYMVDKKMPIHEKENVWVLESDKRIVWVVGMRLDERFKLTPNTSKVLQVQLK